MIGACAPVRTTPARREAPVKRNVMLTVTSVLSVALFVVHVADDIVRGVDKVGPVNLIGVTIDVVWLYGALVLAGRRSGYIIMLLGALFAMLAATGHMVQGVGRALAARPDGTLLFMFTLWALAVTAAFSAVLAVRGLWTREWERST
jgi:hypothetical protein